MAVVTKWITVCDIGGEKCDNTTLSRCRVTIDGKSTTVVLCPQHVAPLRDVLREAAPERSTVIYDTLEEALETAPKR